MRHFKLKINTNNFDVSKMTNVFVVLIILCSFSYAYFVQSSIFNIVERERVNKEISSIGIKISNLETEYLKIRSGINIDIAFKQGFTEDFNKVNFANIDSGNTKGRFSFLSNEI